MLQIIKNILKNSDDFTTISLLFANRTEEDILCREELESIRDNYPHRFKLWFTLDTPTEGNIILYYNISAPKIKLPVTIVNLTQTS